MNRKIITVAVALICLLSVASVWGATTGKITGVVMDSQTKEPLIGVTVAVTGTNLGAITDQDGHYMVLNVPVGTYTLRMTAVGYAELEVAEVHVSADLATYQDQELSSQATDLGKTIRVVAEAPMVMKDKTTTINIVKRDDLLSMPTRGMEQVVGIQNSVVRMNSGNFGQRQRGQRANNSTGTELNLRGGRPSEVAYYVDGFSQQDPLTGVSTTNINNNAIKEISVTSGAFSAEYGHVSSGIVNVVTNSGSDVYAGNIDVLTDNVLSENWDHNFYSGDVGGPVPGIENAYFFFSGERRFQRDRTPSSATEEMHTVYGAPYGLDTLYADDPQRLPSNSLSGWSYQGKLDYQFNPNFKLQLSGNGSVDNWRDYRHEWALNPDHAPRYEDKNLAFNAKVTHTLNANTFYNLSASYFNTKRLRGDGVVFDDYEAYERSYTWDDGEVDDVVNPEYAGYDLFWTPSEEITVAHDPENPETTIVHDTTWLPDSVTVDTITIDTTIEFTLFREETLDMPSYYVGYFKRESSYMGFKGDITSQVNEHNTLKMGFDFQRHTLRQFQNLDATQGYSTTRVNHFGYDSVGNESDDLDWMNDAKHPINLGLYMQDRFDWRGVIVNAGLRFDYFDYKAQRIIDSINPFGAATVGQLDPEDVEDSEKFKRFSPRLGISFPVSDKTQMHVNFGKFFQRPDLNRLYCGYDFWETRVTAGSYYAFPSPNLKPEKTTQYEVGVTHQLGENVALTMGAYFKDVQDLTQIRTIIEVDPTIRSYSTFANIDFATIKGIDFALSMRRTRNVRAELKYTLSYGNGTGSYAQSAYIINWSNPTGQPKVTNPLDYDQRHNLTGLFDLRYGQQQGPKFGDIYPLENFNCNFIVYAGSGTPYTPMNTYDEATEKAVRPGPSAPINSESKPWNFSIDVKLEKTFKVQKFSLTPYVMIKNLLDRENVIGVYESTGQANTCNYLLTDVGMTAIETAGVDYQNAYEFKENNSSNYGNPRWVWAGLRVSF